MPFGLTLTGGLLRCPVLEQILQDWICKRSCIVSFWTVSVSSGLCFREVVKNLACDLLKDVTLVFETEKIFCAWKLVLNVVNSFAICATTWWSVMNLNHLSSFTSYHQKLLGLSMACQKPLQATTTRWTLLNVEGKLCVHVPYTKVLNPDMGSKFLQFSSLWILCL